MKPLTLQEIETEWNKDSKLNGTDLGSDILKTPNLHAKYSSQIVAHRLALKTAQNEYEQLKKLKWHYYQGKLSKEQLFEKNWEQFDLTVGKGDLGMYMSADPDIQTQLSKIEIHDIALEFLQGILKSITYRNQEIKNYIEYRKYELGV